jgi:hypothetical protein
MSERRDRIKSFIDDLDEEPDLAAELWKTLDEAHRKADQQQWANSLGDVGPPCRVKMENDRAIVTFAQFVNHELEPWASKVAGLLAVQQEHDKLITIDLSECSVLTGDWARWLDIVADYKRCEVLGTNEALREIFEARNLERLLGKLC